MMMPMSSKFDAITKLATFDDSGKPHVAKSSTEDGRRCPVLKQRSQFWFVFDTLEERLRYSPAPMRRVEGLLAGSDRRLPECERRRRGALSAVKFAVVATAVASAAVSSPASQTPRTSPAPAYRTPKTPW